MAKYQYETATGAVEIDADPYWTALLKAEDAAEQNSARRHTRPDHKYASGVPVSLDGLRYEGEWLEDRSSGIGAAELYADLERALDSLTELQRRYFVLSRIGGFSNVEIARLDRKDEATVREIIKAAIRKLVNFLG